jgi:hypothetical protein
VASAAVWLQDIGLAHFSVEDMSIGGALLRDAPEVAIGRMLRMFLMLEGAQPLVLDAEVVRWTADDGKGATLAVAFRNLDGEQEDRIQDALLKALEALNGPKSGIRGPIVDNQDGAALGRRERTR